MLLSTDGSTRAESTVCVVVVDDGFFVLPFSGRKSTLPPVMLVVENIARQRHA